MKNFDKLSSRHVRTTNKIVNYGTAGFRDKYEVYGFFNRFRQTILSDNLMRLKLNFFFKLNCFRASELEHIMFRMGILAALRSRTVKGIIFLKAQIEGLNFFLIHLIS